MEKARKEAAEAEEAARLEKLRLKEEARLAELLRMRKAKEDREEELKAIEMEKLRKRQRESLPMVLMRLQMLAQCDKMDETNRRRLMGLLEARLRHGHNTSIHDHNTSITLVPTHNTIFI